MNKKIALLIYTAMIAIQVSCKKEMFDFSRKELSKFDTSFTLAYSQIPVLAHSINNIDQQRHKLEMLENIRIANDIDLEISKKYNSKKISKKQITYLINKFNNVLIHRRHKYINLCKLNIKNPKETIIIAHGVPSRIGKTFEKLSSEYTKQKINFIHIIEKIAQQYITNKTSNFFIQYNHSLLPNTKKYNKTSLVHIITTKNAIFALLIGNTDISLELEKLMINECERTLLDKEIQSKYGNNIVEHILKHYETSK